MGPERVCGRESGPPGKLQMAIGFLINNKPVHEISNNVVCATSKASDQPAHTRSLIRAFSSRVEYSMIDKRLTGHHLEFLSLKRCCRGESKSTLVKMSNCWKSHAATFVIWTT